MREVEVEIKSLSSSGEGVGIGCNADDAESSVVVVPFTVPGDRVCAKVYKTFGKGLYQAADFVRVLRAGPDRDDSAIQCKYFARCGGCQFQMMPYSSQLNFKRTIVERAYSHLSGLSSDQMPVVAPVVGSPLQYQYRTKLTPHFDVPRHRAADKSNAIVPAAEVPIGFTQKGRSIMIDIEECPIATPAINATYLKTRERVREQYHEFKRGATLMLREGVRELQAEGNNSPATVPVVIEDSNAQITEYVGKWRFQYTARDFFQCNSSVLPRVTAYVGALIHGPPEAPLTTEPSKVRYLVDAYCGSGLFGISCSDKIESVIGVEISDQSVQCAALNATENGVKNAEFVVGDATKIFSRIETPADQTAMILDPSRKGCGQPFLDQLMAFRPRRVVYVSCNVHTQARDIGYVLNHENGRGYKFESVRGFDFFPQTHHVESVAVLSLD
ncbi:S-adenosyl-L-methionine-dependent methyltransferase [Lipomyces oligophaga]|uniref:S-adenosyl-L-methionine-dependent methyltransferase n=1 Tax=Lipomyces oligophaga TaxID=45792 RepID=UPI0034CD6EB4